MKTHGGSSTDLVLHWARAYDVLTWVLTMGKERQFRRHLVQLAQVAPGESVLDVGSGTGSLAIVAGEQVGPSGQVSGVDPSAEMVARARAKAGKAGVDVRFETGTVEALPFPDATFDAVLGTLMLHHLTEDGRRQGMVEVTRVLKPGGRFLAVDIGGGTSRKRPGLFCRLPKHAHFDLDEMTPVLEAAGLEVVERGPVGGPRLLGLSNLRFLLVRPQGR